MRTVLTASRLLGPDRIVERPIVVMEDRLIAALASEAETGLPQGRHVALPECTLAPAFFDVHIHGCVGHDSMEATETALNAMGKFLARRGVGAYCATTVTAPLDTILQSLSGLAKLIPKPLEGARPVGIHLEGPFLSPHRRGAHAEHQLLTPSAALFDQMWQASEGTIRVMTIAPELPGAEETIAHASKLGVRISLGHSNADSEAARRGVLAGCVTATHTFNAMKTFDHRDPGIIGEVLTNDALFAEIICDGLHVNPSAVRLFWKAKGAQRALLMTDAMAGTGMGDGRYRLGELEVRVENGRCLIGEDTLAGSTLTMDRALQNFMSFTGAGLAETVGLATRNPARMTGLDDQIGTLAPGRSADIAVFSATNEVVETYLRGEPQLMASGDAAFNG